MILCGTEGRNRTGTPVKEPDFESGVSTNSTTLAYLWLKNIISEFLKLFF